MECPFCGAVQTAPAATCHQCNRLIRLVTRTDSVVSQPRSQPQYNQHIEATEPLPVATRPLPPRAPNTLNTQQARAPQPVTLPPHLAPTEPLFPRVDVEPIRAKPVAINPELPASVARPRPQAIVPTPITTTPAPTELALPPSASAFTPPKPPPDPINASAPANPVVVAMPVAAQPQSAPMAMPPRAQVAQATKATQANQHTQSDTQLKTPNTQPSTQPSAQPHAQPARSARPPHTASNPVRAQGSVANVHDTPWVRPSFWHMCIVGLVDSLAFWGITGFIWLRYLQENSDVGPFLGLTTLEAAVLRSWLYPESIVMGAGVASAFFALTGLVLATRGASLGAFLAGLTLCTIDGKPAGLVRVLLRNLLNSVFTIFFGFGPLWALWVDARWRNWGDLLTRTELRRRRNRA